MDCGWASFQHHPFTVAIGPGIKCLMPLQRLDNMVFHLKILECVGEGGISVNLAYTK